MLQPNHANAAAEITHSLGVVLFLGGSQHNLGLQHTLLCRTMAANQLVKRLPLNLGNLIMGGWSQNVAYFFPTHLAHAPHYATVLFKRM